VRQDGKAIVRVGSVQVRTTVKARQNTRYSTRHAFSVGKAYSKGNEIETSQFDHLIFCIKYSKSIYPNFYLYIQLKSFVFFQFKLIYSLLIKL